MNNCNHLYLLSTIACRLADCLSKEELSIVAADLVVLSDMLGNILARQITAGVSDLPDISSDTK